MPYSGDPSSSARDQVRFLVGDTNNAKLELADAEIDFLLVQADGSAAQAAPFAAEALAGKFSREVSYSAGRVSKQLGQRAAAMRELAAQLRRQLALNCIPISTGQDPQADIADAQNEALKQPQFVLEQMDNPQATRPSVVPREEEDWR